MPDADPASAARRVAEDTRRDDGTAPTVFLSAQDARTLLPIFDAVAAGQGGERRVERIGRAIFSAMWGRQPDVYGPSYEHDHEDWEAGARAAIALADAEGVAAAQSDFAKACAHIDRRSDEIEASAAETRARIRAGVREPKGRFSLRGAPATRP